MSKLRVQSFAISIEGYGAGPNQDLQNPLGVGGPELMEWFFHTRTWQRMHGGEDGETAFVKDSAGQVVKSKLDEKRLQRIRQLVRDGKTPITLDDFWKGQEKYGLSGSIVAFIDKKYGREKLFGLLKLINKQDTLNSLGLSEEQLLKEWRESF